VLIKCVVTFLPMSFYFSPSRLIQPADFLRYRHLQVLVAQQVLAVGVGLGLTPPLPLSLFPSISSAKRQSICTCPHMCTHVRSSGDSASPTWSSVEVRESGRGEGSDVVVVKCYRDCGVCWFRFLSECRQEGGSHSALLQVRGSGCGCIVG